MKWLPLLALLVFGCEAPREEPGKPITPEAKPVATAPPVPVEKKSETHRFQMFYSPLVRADTFLVDTATGKVSQLFEDKTVEGFQDIKVEGQADPLTLEPGRFTISFSTLVRADTYLVDTVTGKTWQMQQGADKQFLFSPLVVPFDPPASN